jgi:hypothetical protein
VVDGLNASSVAGLLELSDSVVKMNVAAADILNARVTEVFDEFWVLFAGRGAHPTATTAGPSITARPIDVVEEVAPIGDAFSAVSPTATVPPPSARRTATRTAKSASKTSTRASKATAKTSARAAKAAARRRTPRR